MQHYEGKIAEMEEQRTLAVQHFEGKIAEMEEERALAIQQAVDESVNLKLRKLQTRLESMEKESRDLREVHSCSE